jgi:UDP-N-acetyl-D-glucosamine dehydrogenase
VTIVGMGYVGLPLTVCAAENGFNVHGVDIDKNRISALRRYESPIGSVSQESLERLMKQGRLSFYDDFDCIAKAHVVIVCVPTPLTVYREPDLSYVINAITEISKRINPGALVVLESTTFPGTTREIVAPLLRLSENQQTKSVHIAFSPEREDPGNEKFGTATIPKIVAGLDEFSTRMALSFYRKIVKEVVEVSSPEIAESSKILENVFRAVNIALVNELKVIFDGMGIDVWEVINAAATKPFGFMPFYPGPGLGGHCIPVDPFYLSWKAKEFGLVTSFIELSAEVNMAMPEYVMNKVIDTLDIECKKSLSTSSVLVVGAAYKKNVGDVRESPAVEILERIVQRGCEVILIDPHVNDLTSLPVNSPVYGLESQQIDQLVDRKLDLILILTDHDDVDYSALVELGLPIVDTRNVIQKHCPSYDRLYKA